MDFSRSETPEQRRECEYVAGCSTDVPVTAQLRPHCCPFPICQALLTGHVPSAQVRTHLSLPHEHENYQECHLGIALEPVLVPSPSGHMGSNLVPTPLNLRFLVCHIGPMTGVSQNCCNHPAGQNGKRLEVRCLLLFGGSV